jgi:hypothetical protein
VDRPPAFECFGNIYSPNGETYGQKPRSLAGKLSKFADLMLDVLSEHLGNHIGTNIRDQDLADLVIERLERRYADEDAGKSPDEPRPRRWSLRRKTILRRIQAALLELQTVEWMKRVREHGRRIIEVLKNLLPAKPKPKPAAGPAAQAGTRSATPAPKTPAVANTDMAKYTIDAMAELGAEPYLDQEDRLQWRAIAGRERGEPDGRLRRHLTVYASAIREMLLAARHRRE